MAEIVQRRMELMAEEFEEMRRTKLFSPDEIRALMKKRRDFEHKTHSVTKNLQDFKDYIQYEKYLLKDIRLRRDKHKIYEKKGSLERNVIKRIKNLYETALQRFSNEFSLYLSYFKFCKQVNFINAASLAVENMIKNHIDKPEVWQVAAAWHANDRKDIHMAVKIIVKGLTIHKSNKLLYTDAIKFELLIAENKQPQKTEQVDTDEQNKQKICCEKLKTYINAIVTNVKDINYYIEILNLLESYVFTAPIQIFLIKNILEEHSDKEIVWHTLAQRERNGFHYASDAEEEEEGRVNSTKTRLTCCINKYREGLKKVNKDEKQALWSKFIECLIEIKHENNKVANITKANSLKQALEEAYEENCLSEKYFVTWLETVDDAEALSILEKGTTAFPQSVDLWKLRLRYQTLKDVPAEVNHVFKMGILALKDKALPLWCATIQYHLLTCTDDVIELIYKDGVKQPPEVSSYLKPRYVEWLSLARGINASRKAYNLLVNEKPYCKELHIVMSKLESIEIEYNFTEWEKVHENACEQFGKEEVDVWINYMEFFGHYNKNEQSNENIQKLYKRAQDSLPPLLMSYFNERYNNLLATL